MAEADKLFLITGATGRTGGHTARLWLGRGHRVHALVHRDDERAEHLRAQSAEVVQHSSSITPLIARSRVG